MITKIKQTQNGWIYMELDAVTCAPGLLIEFKTKAEAVAEYNARNA